MLRTSLIFSITNLDTTTQLSDNTSSPSGRPGGVLITGASGFVGQHLTRLLSSKGKQVRALYNSRKPANDLTTLPGVEWMKCDVLDIYDVEAAMQGIAEVYHCAAVVSFHPKKKEEMMLTNVEGTTNIVNEALEQGVRKIVFLSSVAALGRNVQTKEINEDEQWEEGHLNSAYSQSKYLSELEVWRGIGEGLEGAVVNPGIILGEGDWNLGSARLMKLAYDEFPFYTEGINGWVDVQDVVKTMYMLMESNVTAERFILSEDNYSYRDVFTMMATSLERKPPHIKATPFMTGLIWRWNMLKSMLTGAEITITKETARNAQGISLYRNDKLGKHLPDFSYTPLKDTIDRIAKAYIQDKDRTE